MSVVDTATRMIGADAVARRQALAPRLELDPYRHVASAYERYAKPVLDRMGAAILLVVVVPLLLMCAVLVLA